MCKLFTEKMRNPIYWLKVYAKVSTFFLNLFFSEVFHLALTYKSFYWCLGTTSFRTKNFNKRIEQQLALLRDFWKLPENVSQEWAESNGVQTDYYNFLHDSGFLIGNAGNKAKDAREKTSGLVSLGLIHENRRLTNVGQVLLNISEKNNFVVNNVLGIPADSFIYFKQLLKTSLKIETAIVRPFIVTVYLIEKLDGLSQDEFTYVVPLVVDKTGILNAVQQIKDLRAGMTNIDDIILARLMSMENYQEALKYFLQSESVTNEIIADIGLNRKSRSYDKSYYPLYVALKRFYINDDKSAEIEMVQALRSLSNTGTMWQKYLFGDNSLQKIKKSPKQYLRATRFDTARNEFTFRRAFFETLHVIKAKRSLQDYFDLNRRYMKTADILLFADEKVTLDTIPRHYFASVCDKLLDIAFTESDMLKIDSELAEIAPFLQTDESAILDGINREFSLNLKSLQAAGELVSRQRYLRLNHLIDSKFTDEQLLKILDLIAERSDKEIQARVTDNADIPTIFEYILGILWYKISNRRGKILDYMKLSLDVDLLPKTHAAGGEADIVYEYDATNVYPAHSLLLEATLTDRTNQRRMEMEPVSRHLGNHLLITKNFNSYCVFATNELNINVVSDFRGRKHQRYYDVSDENIFIDGMKIIPLQIDDLKSILQNHFNYDKLYLIFEAAHKSELAPREWRQKLIVRALENFGR